MAALPATYHPADDQNDLHWENGVLVIPIAKARINLSELANQAAYTKERIVLTRRGRRIAAIVPIDDINLLEQLEDRADIAAVQEVKANGEYDERISLEDLKRELGL